MTSIPLLVETSEWKNPEAFISKIKHFFGIFTALFESALNFEPFRTKMTLIAYVFKKLPTTKDVLK